VKVVAGVKRLNITGHKEAQNTKPILCLFVGKSS